MMDAPRHINAQQTCDSVFLCSFPSRGAYSKQLSTAGERAERKQAWEHAYLTTPHGKPVELG